MKRRNLWDDTQGNALVEFTVTLPLFFLLTFGLVQAGLLLYTQAGLQHGVETAARCASVNYSAYQIGLSQSCFGVDPSTVTTTTIQNYAIQNSWGIVPPSSDFTVTTPSGGGACGTNSGYVVTASHYYNLINYIFKVTLSAEFLFSDQHKLNRAGRLVMRSQEVSMTGRLRLEVFGGPRLPNQPINAYFLEGVLKTFGAIMLSLTTTITGEYLSSAAP